MTCANVVNERSTARLTVNFADEDGDPVIPTSAEYRVSCPDNGTTVRDWEDAGTPAAEMEIELEPEDHEMLTTKSMEGRVVDVRAPYGVDKQATARFSYSLRNLGIGSGS